MLAKILTCQHIITWKKNVKKHSWMKFECNNSKFEILNTNWCCKINKGSQLWISSNQAWSMKACISLATQNGFLELEIFICGYQSSYRECLHLQPWSLVLICQLQVVGTQKSWGSWPKMWPCSIKSTRR